MDGKVDDTNIFGVIPGSDGIDIISSDSDESLYDKEYLFQKFWTNFQLAAISVSRLYKLSENLSKNANESNNLYNQFQNASEALTNLYTGAMDCQNKRFEVGYIYGQRRRSNDIRKWVNSQKSIMRRHKREELLTYLDYLDAKVGCSKRFKKYLLSNNSPNSYRSSPRGSAFSSSPSPSPKHHMRYTDRNEANFIYPSDNNSTAITCNKNKKHAKLFTTSSKSLWDRNSSYLPSKHQKNKNTVFAQPNSLVNGVGDDMHNNFAKSLNMEELGEMVDGKRKNMISQQDCVSINSENIEKGENLDETLIHNGTFDVPLVKRHKPF